MFTTLQEGIAAIQKQILSDTPPEQALYIPAQGTHTTVRDEKPFDLYQALSEFVVFDNKIIADEKDSKSSVDQKAIVVKTETRRKVLLLLGETGSGKSVFCQDLIARLWQNYKLGMPIPLFIPLARLQDPINNAITETFTEYGFSVEQIATLKAEQQFIFILDGYDEIHQLKNLYVTNRLGEWQAKTIITCRSQYLYHVNESDKYFMPFAAEKRQPHLLQQLHVAPFAEKEIVAYVQQYEKTALSPNCKSISITVAEDSKDHKSDDKTAVASQPLLYQELISVPGLQTLITTPFLLHLAVEALPEILEKTKDQKNNDQPNFTQAALYDVFIARWFKRQEIKLRTSKHIDEKVVDPKPTFWNFCKALAVAMRAEQVNVVNYAPEKTSRLFAAAASAKIDPWKDFFSNDAETELLRSACPLRKFGKNQYGFIHGSMIEYFATRTMYDELITQPQATVATTNTLQVADTKDSKSNILIAQNLNQQTNSNPLPKNALYQTLISKDANMIQFLADRVAQDEKFKQKLFEIIELSKTNESYVIGAANSITALARAKIAFSGMDLSGICINGADVSYGIFDNTNLTGASLQNVDMQGTWLREAKLNNADMTDAEFGELPSILAPQGIDAFGLSADGHWYVVGSDKKIFLYKMDARKLEHVFEGHTESIVGARFMLNDTMLVSRDSYNENSTIKFWDIKNKKLVCSYDEKQLGLSEDWFRVFSPTQAVFASFGGKDGNIRLWNVYTGKLEHTFKAHKDKANQVIFSPNGLILASGGSVYDKTISLWDMTNRTLLHTFEGHTLYINYLAFSNNNLMLASTSGDNTLCIWDIANRKRLHVFESPSKSTLSAIGFSPDNNWLVAGQDKIVQLWNIANHKLEYTFEGHTENVSRLFFHPDGQSIISTSFDSTVRLWLMPKQKSSQNLEEQSKAIENIAFSPNGRWLASANLNHDAISLYDIVSGGIKCIFKMQKTGINNVVFSSNDHLISGGFSAILETSNIISRQRENIFKNGFPAADSVDSLACHPIDPLFAAGNNDHTIRLWDSSHGKLIHTFEGHTNYVTSVSFSPNGCMLASASGGQDKTVRLWDVVNKKLIDVFDNSKDSSGHPCFSADNRWLASTAGGKSIHLWDVVNRKLEIVLQQDESASCWTIAFHPLRFELAAAWNLEETGLHEIRLYDVASQKVITTLKGHTASIYSIAFSPNGLWLVSSGKDKTARLWDISNAKELRSFQHEGDVSSVAFDAKGETLATGMIGQYNKVQLWKVTTGEFLYAINEGSSKLVFSSDGRKLILAGFCFEGAQIWNLSERKLEHHLKRNIKHGKITHIAVSSDKRKLATASFDYRVRLWDLVNNKLECTFEGHTDEVNCVVFSPNGTQLLSGGKDKQIRLWNVVTHSFERIFAEVEDATFGVNCIDFNSNGHQIAAGDYKNIKLWNAATGKLEQIFQTHTGRINKVSFSPSGLMLASASDDCTVRLWRVSDLKSTQELVFNGHTDDVCSVSFAPNNNIFASTSKDKTIRLWDRVNQKLLQQFDLQNQADSIAFSPDGLKLVVGSGNEVQLWDIATGKCVHTFDGHSNSINKVSFSPSGLLIASASHDKTVRLWNVVKQNYVYVFAGHTDPVFSVSFSNNGRQLVSASQDSTIRLWDVVNKKHLHTFIGHSDKVCDVVFSPDDRWLASVSSDKTVRLWDINNRKLEESFIGASKAVSVAFHPNGRWVASGNWYSTIQLWNLNTGALEHTFDAKIQVDTIAFSQDGQWLVAGGVSSVIKLWNVSNSTFNPCCAIVKGFSGNVKSVAWQATTKGLFLATGSSDHAVRYWQVEEDKAQNVSVKLRWSTRQKALIASDADMRDMKGLVPLSQDLLKQRGAMTTVRKIFPAQTTVVDYKRDYKEGVFVTSDTKQNDLLASEIANTVRLVEILPVFKEHTKEVNCVAFSRDGCWIASGSDDNTVRLWDIVNRKPEYILQGHTDQVNSVAFSPNDQWLASGSKDATIRLWDRASGKLQFIFNGTNAVVGIAFSPNGQYLVSGDLYVRLLRMADGAVQHIYRELSFYGKNIVFNPNGQWVAGGGKDNTVGLWSVINKKLEHTFVGHTNRVQGVVFSLDGRKLISGGLDKTMRLWDMASRSCEHVFAADAMVFSLSFSFDSRYVVAGCGRSIQLWSMIDKKRAHAFEGHNGIVRSVAFSANGFKLVSGGDDTLVRLWDAKDYLLSDQSVDSKRDHKESAAVYPKQNVAPLAVPQTFFAPQSQQPIRTSMSARPPAIQQYVQPVMQNTMQQQPQFFAAQQPIQAAVVKARDFKREEAIAQFELGNAYFTGRGVPRDYFKAFECYQKASKKYPEALLSMSNCYEKGLGVSKDEVNLIKAADLKAEYKRRVAYEQDYAAEQNMMPVPATAAAHAPISIFARPPAIQQYVQPVMQNTMQQQPQFFAAPVQYQQPLAAVNPNQFYVAAPAVHQQVVYQPQFFAPQQQAPVHHYPVHIMQQPPASLSVQNNAAPPSDCCCVIS